MIVVKNTLVSTIHPSFFGTKQYSMGSSVIETLDKNQFTDRKQLRTVSDNLHWLLHHFFQRKTRKRQCQKKAAGLITTIPESKAVCSCRVKGGEIGVRSSTGEF